MKITFFVVILILSVIVKMLTEKNKQKSDSNRKIMEEKAVEVCEAGADIIVVGNAVEKNPLLIKELVQAIK